MAQYFHQVFRSLSALLAMALLFCWADALASPLELVDDAPRYSPLQHLRIYPDPDGLHTIEDPTSLLDGPIEDAHPFTGSVVGERSWVFLDLHNSSAKTDWVAAFHLPSIDTVAVVVFDDQGQVLDRRLSGRAHHAWYRDFPVVGHHSQLSLQPGQNYRLAFLFENSTPPPPNLAELEIVSRDYFLQVTYRLNIALFMSLGILLALTIYMFFLWARLRETAHLWFSGFCFFALLMWSTHYELFRLLFFPEVNSVLANYLATSAMIFCILLFTRDFLKLSDIAPLLSRVFAGTAALVVLLMGALPVIRHSPLAYHLNATAAGVALLLVAVATFQSLRARAQAAPFFLLGFSIFFFSSTLTVFNALFLALPTATLRLVTLLTTALGVLTMALSVANQIHSLRAGIVDARHKARTDPLTGLQNRTAFEEDIKSLQEDLRRGDLHDITLVYADLDGLKRLNDTEGHHRGDEILQAFAAQLSHRFRDQDRLYRMGGDEFLILLPQTDDQDPTPWLTERFATLTQSLRDAGFQHFGVSHGTSSIVAHGGAEAALKTADERMYARKAG